MQLDNIPATIKTARAMKAFILSRFGIYVWQKPRQLLALLYSSRHEKNGRNFTFHHSYSIPCFMQSRLSTTNTYLNCITWIYAYFVLVFLNYKIHLAWPCLKIRWTQNASHLYRKSHDQRYESCVSYFYLDLRLYSTNGPLKMNKIKKYILPL